MFQWWQNDWKPTTAMLSIVRLLIPWPLQALPRRLASCRCSSSLLPQSWINFSSSSASIPEVCHTPHLEQIDMCSSPPHFSRTPPLVTASPRHVNNGPGHPFLFFLVICTVSLSRTIMSLQPWSMCYDTVATFRGSRLSLFSLPPFPGCLWKSKFTALVIVKIQEIQVQDIDTIFCLISLNVSVIPSP